MNISYLYASESSSMYDTKLSSREKEPIKERAKAFERKLKNLGADSFVKQHIDARKEEIGIYSAARYCVADYNPKKDSKFGTPLERFYQLLGKAQKYQKDEEIDKFSQQVEEKINKKIDEKGKQIQEMYAEVKRQEQELSDLTTNKAKIVRENTKNWMQEKLDYLDRLFKESQEISPRHKDVKKQLDAHKRI